MRRGYLLGLVARERPHKKTEMLSVKETARRVGQAERTVRQWFRAGKLKGAELVNASSGNYWLIPASALNVPLAGLRRLRPSRYESLAE